MQEAPKQSSHEPGAGKPPVINCHTHIFTGDHVPPWLARTFLPWPFYYLLPLSGIVGLLRWWYKGPNQWKYSVPSKKWIRFLYKTRMWLRRHFVLSALYHTLGIFLTWHVFFGLYDLLGRWGLSWPGRVTDWIERIREAAGRFALLQPVQSWPLQVIFVIFLLLFFQSGRNFLLFVLKMAGKMMLKLPGKQTLSLLQRYLLIGRFSRYQKQAGIFSKLRDQYPTGTGFVVLPMDMAYMGAGRLKPGYELDQQMDELSAIRKQQPDIFHPFVFADPRRLQDDPGYFSYRTDEEGNVVLNDCKIKRWIETEGFAGFKIYPALGYYPFDERLLVLWKYAADRGLPVLTHCIRGTIFYRGPKKKEWDEHPVFRQSMTRERPPFDWTEDQEPEGQLDRDFPNMLLPERKNADFSVNFTHPLNYLCLLDESLLARVISQSADPGIRQVFGFRQTDKGPEVTRNLRHLKLCFGHFGGDDEWKRFMERDRDNYSSQLLRYPQQGLAFLHNHHGPDRQPRAGKPEQIWKHADWYTIICSLMLQYPRVYADISYILHQPAILPLLKKTLAAPVLQERVLYGSDFYVVRNHKSDKEMLAEMQAGLTEEEFDRIARYNPQRFLQQEQKD